MSISSEIKSKVLGKVSFVFTRDEELGNTMVTFASTDTVMLAMVECFSYNYGYSPTVQVPSAEDATIMETVVNPETAQEHAMRRIVEFAADNFVIHQQRLAEVAKQQALNLIKDGI